MSLCGAAVGSRVTPTCGFKQACRGTKLGATTRTHRSCIALCVALYVDRPPYSCRHLRQPKQRFTDPPLRASAPPSAVSHIAAKPTRRRRAAAPSALFTGLVQGTAEVLSFDKSFVGDYARLTMRFPPSTLDGEAGQTLPATSSTAS
jgi:hypothetical protein